MATRSRPGTSPGRSGELNDEQAPKPYSYTFSILGFGWTLTGDKPLSGWQFVLASAATVTVNVLGMTLLLSAILVGAVAVAQGWLPDLPSIPYPTAWTLAFLIVVSHLILNLNHFNRHRR